jgi:uncharacterized protein (TIGR03435 family)
MQKTGRNILIGASFAFALLPLVSQSLLSQTPAAQKPTFEVTSVKPGAQTGFRGGGPRGNTFNVTGPLRIMVLMAYSRGIAGPGPGVPIQITGAPGWMDSELFDVQAKADCSSGPISPEQMQLMLQSLLEERFQLKAHYETREMPLYHLVVVKEGKMKLSEDQTPPVSQTGGPLLCGPLPAPSAAPAGPRGIPFDPNKPSTFPRGSMVMSMNSTTGMTVTATATPIEGVVGMLQGRAGRTVINKTNLTGLFDISLRFSPEGQPGLAGPGAPPPNGGPAGIAGAGGPGGTTPNAASEPLPSLFTAVQEQLGLKLESTKGPVEILVIDSVQKPTQN